MVKSGQNLEMSTWNKLCFVSSPVLPNKYLHRQRNEGNNINKLFVFVDVFLKG